MFLMGRIVGGTVDGSGSSGRLDHFVMGWIMDGSDLPGTCCIRSNLGVLPFPLLRPLFLPRTLTLHTQHFKGDFILTWHDLPRTGRTNAPHSLYYLLVLAVTCNLYYLYIYPSALAWRVRCRLAYFSHA